MIFRRKASIWRKKFALRPMCFEDSSGDQLWLWLGFYEERRTPMNDPGFTLVESRFIGSKQIYQHVWVNLLFA